MTQAALSATLDEAMALLGAAAGEAGAAFRTPTLATVDADGAPQQRTVVLRAVDPAARWLDLHTDVRSAKYHELSANPRAALHVWDAARRLQVRLSGTAGLHSGDAVARAAWEALSSLGRQLYRVRQAPGTPLADPSATQFDEYPEAAGFAAFAVVRLAFSRLETLRLTGHGQIRARFEWPGGAMAGTWLVP